MSKAIKVILNIGGAALLMKVAYSVGEIVGGFKVGFSIRFTDKGDILLDAIDNQASTKNKNCESTEDSNPSQELHSL